MNCQHICKHIAKAAQADAQPKLWQRACKSEPAEFKIFLPRAVAIGFLHQY